MHVDYVLHLLVFVMIYGMLALTLNVASGLTNLVSLAHAGFFGVGAYSTAVLATRFGSSVWFNLPVGMLLAGLIALPIALLARRIVDDYFLLCTLSLNVVILSVFNNCDRLTRGPMGLAGIPPVSFLGFGISSKLDWVLLTGAAYSVVFCVARNLKKSPLGRVLLGISEDEVFCQSLGKNVGSLKLQSFVLGAMLAAIPGAFYAHYISFVDPTSFTVNESIFLFSIVIIGGLGRLWASLSATIFVIIMPEALRFLGIPSHVAAGVHQLVYGLLIVAVVLRRGTPSRLLKRLS